MPARQFPGSGSPRSDRLQRIEDILQALGRETETVVLDREPKIIPWTATWKIDNRIRVDREMSRPNHYFSALRHVGGRLDDEKADQCGHGIGIPVTPPGFRLQ